jgi:hypothetical protein
MTETEWLCCEDPTPMLEFLRGRVSDRKLRLFGCACCRRIWHLLPDEGCKEAIKRAESYAEGSILERERREALGPALESYIYSAAAAEVALAGTWNPLDCLAAEHDADQYEGMFAWACEEARRSPLDACEAWVAREAAQAAYYTLVVDDACMPSASYHAAYAVAFFYGEDGWEAYCKRGGASAETSAQRRIFRDIFGNPFRPLSINPSWLTPTVLNLTQPAYDERIMPAGDLDPHRLAVLSDALEEAGCDNDDILSHLRGPGPHVRGCWVVDMLLGKG